MAGLGLLTRENLMQDWCVIGLLVIALIVGDAVHWMPGAVRVLAGATRRFGFENGLRGNVTRPNSPIIRDANMRPFSEHFRPLLEASSGRLSRVRRSAWRELVPDELILETAWMRRQHSTVVQCFRHISNQHIRQAAQLRCGCLEFLAIQMVLP